jgi:hypothetical protein
MRGILFHIVILNGVKNPGKDVSAVPTAFDDLDPSLDVRMAHLLRMTKCSQPVADSLMTWILRFTFAGLTCSG